MKLWSTLEAAGELSDVLIWWQMQLDTEFESLCQFLIATNRNAATYPKPIGRRLRVVADSFGVAALDHTQDRFIALQPADVVCWRWDVRAFSRQIADALNIDANHEPIGRTLHETLLGDLPVELGGRPVYLCLRGQVSLAATAITHIAAHAKKPYLVLHPTGRVKTSAISAFLKATDGVLMSLYSLIQYHDGSLTAVEHARRKLLLALGFAEAEPIHRNTFQLIGNIREIWFAGKRHMMVETAGTWCIAALLAQPNRPIEATELEALRLGTDARRAGGLSEEITDAESILKYKSRVTEIAAELEAAKRNNDIGAIASLESERFEIIKTIDKAKGIGGKIRKKSDASRTANTISQNITRDIKKIRESHEELANHLSATITRGSTLVYRPDREYDWML
ncbi:hypothetical protein SH139x_002005 [Planctomycetaceae bacterium SH139]